jgi:hypothetical protein
LVGAREYQIVLCFASDCLGLNPGSGPEGFQTPVPPGNESFLGTNQSFETLRVFFKGGWRRSSLGHLVHQVALLERGRRAMAIAVLTEANPSHGYGRETVRGIAARVGCVNSIPSK